MAVRQARRDIRSVCGTRNLLVGGVVCLLLTGCSASDKHPMRNRETGKVVYCTTGFYRFEPSEHNITTLFIVFVNVRVKTSTGLMVIIP